MIKTKQEKGSYSKLFFIKSSLKYREWQKTCLPNLKYCLERVLKIQRTRGYKFKQYTHTKKIYIILTNVENAYDTWMERPGEVIHTRHFVLTVLDPCLKSFNRAFVRQIHIKMQYFTCKTNEDHSVKWLIFQLQFNNIWLKASINSLSWSL